MTRRAVITMLHRAFLGATMLAGALATAGLMPASPGPATGALAIIAVASLAMVAVTTGSELRSVIAAILSLLGPAPTTPDVADVERCAIRQSDPDAAGHARPRAPGMLPSVVRGQLH